MTGEVSGNPLQYSCLENPMDRGAWWVAVHGVAKSRTRLNDFTFTFHFHALENPLQCSCLENPRDGGAWWAAVYGVAQSQTRLTRLNSNSSSSLDMTHKKTTKDNNSNKINLTYKKLVFVHQKTLSR